MRFVIELRHGLDDTVAGTVSREAGGPVAFSGWLELLRLLEAGPELAFSRSDAEPDEHEDPDGGEQP